MFHLATEASPDLCSLCVKRLQTLYTVSIAQHCTQLVSPKGKHQFLNQTKLPFSQHLHSFSSLLKVEYKEFSYFQGSKSSKLFHEKKNTQLYSKRQTKKRYLLEISDTRALTLSISKTERGHKEYFVNRMNLFV